MYNCIISIANVVDWFSQKGLESQLDRDYVDLILKIRSKSQKLDPKT